MCGIVPGCQSVAAFSSESSSLILLRASVDLSGFIPVVEPC